MFIKNLWAYIIIHEAFEKISGPISNISSKDNKIQSDRQTKSTSIFYLHIIIVVFLRIFFFYILTNFDQISQIFVDHLSHQTSQIMNPDLTLSLLLEHTVCPIFISILETQSLRKKNTKSKPLLNKLRANQISLKTVKPNLYNFVKLPSKPILKSTAQKQQVHQYFLNPQKRFRRAYAQQFYQKEHSIQVSNLEKYRQICKKMISKMASRQNQKFPECSGPASSEQIMNAVSKCSQDKFRSLLFNEYSTIFASQNIQKQLKLPKLFNSKMGYPQMNKTLRKKILFFETGFQLKEKRCHAYLTQMRQTKENMNQYEHWKHQFLNESASNEQELNMLKDQQTLKNNQLEKAKRKIHSEVMSHFQFSRLKEYEPRKIQSLIQSQEKFEQFSRKRQMKIRIPGKLIYETEQHVKKSGNILSKKIQQLSLNRKNHLQRFTFPNYKNQNRRKPIEPSEKRNDVQIKRMNKFRHQLEFDQSQGKDQQLFIRRSTIAENFPKEKPNNCIKVPPKATSNFGKVVNGKSQLLRYQNPSINKNRFQEKKRELLDFMNQRQPLRNPSMQFDRKYASNQALPLVVHQGCQSPQIKLKKSVPTNSIYPFVFGSLVIEGPSQCWLQYSIETVKLKELALRFLSDRRRYCVNCVRLLSSPVFQTPDEYRKKTMKCLQILNSLGAVTWLTESKPYKRLNMRSNVKVEIGVFMTGKTPTEVWNLAITNNL